MAIQVSSIKTRFERYKRDISDFDNVFVDWCEDILYFIYERLKNIDPERFIQQELYYVVTDPDVFTLPSDFMDMRQTNCGMFEVDYATLLYDGQTSNFTAELTLTGGTSGATAYIVSDTDGGTTGSLKLRKISGTFQDNETITDSSTGSATANGAPTYTMKNLPSLAETTFSDTSPGFYISGASNINFTGITDKTYLMRYVPQPPTLTSTNDYFTLDGTSTGQVLIEDRHKKYLMKALDEMMADYDEDLSYENIADFRFVRELGEILSTSKRTAQVYYLDDFTQNA